MPQQAIKVEGVWKRFGDVTALAGIDLEVQSGEIFALLGRNGAGKTTTVRMLTTNVLPDEGRAEVLGLDTRTQAGEVRTRIGLAGQAATVDGVLTGRENLHLLGRLSHLRRADVRRRADELLARFDLTEAADRPVRTYSGGMRRRLDVAAALVHRPAVLFLDEPTTGLDIESRTALWETVRELVGDGTTVLLTTQYLEEADRLANHIAVIGDGRLLAEGSPAELKARLGSAVVEITFATDATTAAAADALTDIGAGEVQREGTTLRVPTHDGARAVMAAMTRLDARNLVPQGLTLREPSLDEVVLDLTTNSSRPMATAAGAREETR